MLEYINAEIVEQDLITALDFMENEVLESKDEISDRAANLEIALSLSSNYHRQSELVFETMEGIKKTQTTIWAITDRNVILSGGNFIPVHCIREVQIL